MGDLVVWHQSGEEFVGAVVRERQGDMTTIQLRQGSDPIGKFTGKTVAVEGGACLTPALVHEILGPADNYKTLYGIPDLKYKGHDYIMRIEHAVLGDINVGARLESRGSRKIFVGGICKPMKRKLFVLVFDLKTNVVQELPLSKQSDLKLILPCADATEYHDAMAALEKSLAPLKSVRSRAASNTSEPTSSPEAKSTRKRPLQADPRMKSPATKSDTKKPKTEPKATMDAKSTRPGSTRPQQTTIPSHNSAAELSQALKSVVATVEALAHRVAKCEELSPIPAEQQRPHHGTAIGLERESKC